MHFKSAYCAKAVTVWPPAPARRNLALERKRSVASASSLIGIPSYSAFDPQLANSG
jgi:hypothetical protein